MVDYLIQTQPQLQAMGPGIRQFMQSEEFRRTITDPAMLRNIVEMNRMVQQMGIQVPGMPGAGRQQSFPAPGVTNTTPPNQQTGARTGVTSSPPQGQQQAPVNPFEAMFSSPPPAPGTNTNTPNPFMALLNQPYASPALQQTAQPQPQQQQQQQAPQQQPPPQHQPQQGFGTQSTPLNQLQPPFGSLYATPHSQQQQQPSQPAFGQGQQPPQDFQSMLSMLQNLQSVLGQGGTPASALPGAVPNLYVPAAPPPAASADSRPLEERYQVNPHLHRRNIYQRSLLKTF